MLYSFSKLNNKVTDYLIDKIIFMKDSSFHNITMQIRKDCILSIDYGLPNIINDGLRKSIAKKNDKAIDAFLGAGADPEIARGVIIDSAIKNNDYERLKLITQHYKFDLSEYIEIPKFIENVFGAQAICKNIIFEAQQEYLKSDFASVHKMEKEQLKELIYTEIDNLDYHKIYQNLTTLFTCMRRFTYKDYQESFADASQYALKNKNDYAVTALAELQKEQKNPQMDKFINYAIETKNMYLLDLVVDNSRIDLIPLIPVPKFLFKEDDNLFNRSLNINTDSTLGPINKMFKEEFRDLNFSNSIFQHYQKILSFSSGAISLIVPTLAKYDIDKAFAINTSLGKGATYAQRVADMMRNENIEWISNKNLIPVTVLNRSEDNNIQTFLKKDDLSGKQVIYAEKVADMITKENTTKFIQQRRIDSIVLPPAPILEKVKYKAEPKIPFKHILNTKNEIVSILEIQKKWDKALITEFFNIAGEKNTMKEFTFKFLEDNHTSFYTIFNSGPGLKRAPFKGMSSHFQCDVSKFVENYIPKLHKILKRKTKDEVFERIDSLLNFLDTKIISTQRLKEVYAPVIKRNTI